MKMLKNLLIILVFLTPFTVAAYAGPPCVQVIIHLENSTETTATITNLHLKHGKWSTTPLKTVTTETPIVIKAESDGFMTGVEGSFEIRSAGKFATIYMDAPFAGHRFVWQKAGDLKITELRATGTEPLVQGLTCFGHRGYPAFIAFRID